MLHGRMHRIPRDAVRPPLFDGDPNHGGLAGDPDERPKRGLRRPEPPMSGIFGIPPANASIDPREPSISRRRRPGMAH